VKKKNRRIQGYDYFQIRAKMGVDTARKLILGYKWKNELFCSYSADGRMAVSNIDVCQCSL